MAYNVTPPPTAGPSGTKAFHTILAGRKCYRVSKDKNEVVWPPHLEAALMEGLEKYTPAESKSPRGLSRFPNRNKFIAQYILQKTGQIRSAKQVGSRIQQLRDTSAGKNIMKAISDRHYEMMHPSRQSPSEQDAQGLGVPALTFSGSGAINMPSSNPPVIQVYISVPPVSPPNTATWPPSSNLSHLPRRTDVTVYDNTYEFVEPRLLRTIDPRVTFVSTSPLPLYSRCNVYRGSTIVHVGDAAMMVVQPMTPDESGLGGFLHYTNLAPGYWDTLCSCDDLSPYSVVQEITKQSIDPTQKAATVMHIQYQFMQTSSGQSPRSLSPFALNAEFDYDADSGSDIFPLFSGQMSTGSESPLPSDRSSSPSHSIPTGFSSQPISPTGWVPQEQWTPFGAAAGTNPLSQFPTSGYYDVQQPQHHQAASYHSGPHQSHQPSPPGQFLGPPSF
ncbi:uncharacterized protein TRAVEDRAFT_65868 [Trametes versicolor FP-101664 SS1]|uniref:uncharacterized protein n=1 Tax=Trametes versicolor (strain FP-101664) TaxID=717944 RepID=UPI0004623121|nr:uncharacterized protein TRAVEDRAFT_65868 [Trametes versicolor FP-101664 SS1]EIW57038.1 hypothetical protein TRAVEDRAFT_65868 [Trametes versicolor FP-101664 SS1]